VYSAPERAPFLVERVAPFVLRDGARIVVRGTVLGALGEPVREQLYTRRPVRQPGAEAAHSDVLTFSRIPDNAPHPPAPLKSATTDEAGRDL